MWIIQLVLSLVIPVVLISGGRKYIRNMPAYGEKRFLRFHSRRAAVSEEAWNFANNLYAHMLYSSGISIGAVTVIFFLVASRYIHHTWILCFSLMAVQLAGVLAAHTTLPVIGIPVKSANLDGMDALLATVQMPSGIPVATVAIDGANNAAFLAIEILALSDPALAQKLIEYKEEMRQGVLAKDAAMQEKVKEL